MVLNAFRARFSDFDFWRSSPAFSFFFRRPLIRLPIDRTRSALLAVGVFSTAGEAVVVEVAGSVSPPILVESLTMPSICCFCCCWPFGGGRPLVLTGPALAVPLLEPKELSSAPLLLGVGANVTVGAACPACVLATAAPMDAVELVTDVGGGLCRAVTKPQLTGVSTLGDGTNTELSSMKYKSPVSIVRTASLADGAGDGSAVLTLWGDALAIGGGIVSIGGNSAATSISMVSCGGGGGRDRSVGEAALCFCSPVLLLLARLSASTSSEASGMRGRASVVGVFRLGGGSSFGTMEVVGGAPLLVTTADSGRLFLAFCATGGCDDSSSESNAGEEERSTSTCWPARLLVEKLVVSTADLRRWAFAAADELFNLGWTFPSFFTFVLAAGLAWALLLDCVAAGAFLAWAATVVGLLLAVDPAVPVEEEEAAAVATAAAAVVVAGGLVLATTALVDALGPAVEALDALAPVVAAAIPAIPPTDKATMDCIFLCLASDFFCMS